MAAHLICVTSGGGLPVFNRKKGNTETLPFSMIGSLNGVHMFSKLNKCELQSTIMEDHCTVWKEFHESFTLIGIASGCTINTLTKLLEAAFNAMVLVVGSEQLKSQRNVERLKRELRICYPLVDRLMDSLDWGDTSGKHSSDLIMMVETMLCPENHLIQTVLDSFTECIESVYSCILIHGKVAVATESWWSLHPEELRLLALLATLENTTNSKDIPVFLPYKSPNVAYRFVAVMLIPNVQVCCLCGPTPVLEEIEHSAAQCFKSTLDLLESALRCHPKNFPNTLDPELGVLGILLINTKVGKYMISLNAEPAQNKTHRLDVLRTFYYQSVMCSLKSEENLALAGKKEQDKGKKSDKKEDKGEKKAEKSELYTVRRETYWCSEYHKCHAALIDDNIVCVMYNSTIPTFSMRVVTPKLLKLLICDKQVCW